MPKHFSKSNPKYSIFLSIACIRHNIDTANSVLIAMLKCTPLLGIPRTVAVLWLPRRNTFVIIRMHLWLQKCFRSAYAVLMLDSSASVLESYLDNTATVMSLTAGSWGQNGAHLGPTGPRWAPCWPHELCYLGDTNVQSRCDSIVNASEITTTAGCDAWECTGNAQQRKHCRSSYFWTFQTFLLFFLHIFDRAARSCCIFP